MLIVFYSFSLGFQHSSEESGGHSRALCLVSDLDTRLLYVLAGMFIAMALSGMEPGFPKFLAFYSVIK